MFSDNIFETPISRQALFEMVHPATTGNHFSRNYDGQSVVEAKRWEGTSLFEYPNTGINFPEQTRGWRIERWRKLAVLLNQMDLKKTF